MKFLLLVVLALPLAADPLYHIYDCRGKESACQDWFGPRVDPQDGTPQFVQGDRIIANGVDLGPARLDSNPVDPPGTYDVFFDRGPWFFGWNYCCEGDETGFPVSWFVENGSATRYDFTAFYASRPNVSDVSSDGQRFVGNSVFGPYFSGIESRYLDISLVENADEWRPILGGSYESPFIQSIRVNNAGQMLGRLTNASNTTLVTFLVSPIGLPVPGAINPVPEPATAMLIGIGALGIIVRKVLA